MTQKELNDLCTRFQDKSPEELISSFADKYPGEMVFSSSLSAEDQVITAMIASLGKDISIFTLDTGRLFQETYDLLEKTKSFFNIKIKVYFPDQEKVEKMVNEKGINLFYESVENRKECCGIRKTDSLKRALAGNKVWITGIRKDQSVTRFFNKKIEWDEENRIIKINPLLSWTQRDVWKYIKEKDIPYNSLHDKNYHSIGCMPCTRAVAQGEDFRSGRWWWEEEGHKECGIHSSNVKKN